MAGGRPESGAAPAFCLSDRVGRAACRIDGRAGHQKQYKERNAQKAQTQKEKGLRRKT